MKDKVVEDRVDDEKKLPQNIFSFAEDEAAHF